MLKILVLNGPNLNILGSREPGQYGHDSLEKINERIQGLCGEGEGICIFQSNSEHELINKIHSVPVDNIDFVIFNPAGFTHTSIALRDAILGVRVPFIEVHLSNIHAREDFRKHSYFSDIAVGVISGLGPIGYELALQAAIAHLNDSV